jgi:hypothetical protein
MNYNKLNVIIGWTMGLLATIVYSLTLEPTMPFWDCGEFIASVYKLEVGHPPGAPLFMLIGRVFSAFVAPDTVPVMINFLSALCSGLTIVFLFWTITHMAKKFLPDNASEPTKSQLLAILGSGAIGALAYTFSDTFWFSAVEAEVYAMSSLFTAMVFWAILKWEAVVDETGELRWLILIAYLMGLSIGVHLLNLLAIPAICLVYYFKKYDYSIWGLIKTGIISLFLLFLINTGIIIYFVKFAGWFERVFVNSFGMPFNSGGIFYLLLVISLITFAIIYTNKKGMVMLNTLVLGITVAIIGYTTFATVIIRSNANPPMDENNPENLFALLSYLNREQYGDRPLLFGQYFNTPQDYEQPYKDGADVWVKSFSVREDNGKAKLVLSSRDKFTAEQYITEHPDQKLMLVQEYIESGEKKGSIPNYRREFSGYFPRMHSGQANHVKDYKEWSDYQNWNTEKGKEKVTNAEEAIAQSEYGLNYYGQTGKMPRGMENEDPRNLMRSIDRMRAKMIPSAGEDFRFFTSFQIGHMYLRYFMWNFAGRQNDRQGHGEFTEGNWISGVKIIDEERVGNREQLTEIEKNNPGLNYYYFLPLILGFIGLIFQLLRQPKDFSVVALLFILTGVAIIIYLNQTPQQPRERDYAFAGSFYAFAIWIGLSVYALYYAATTWSWKNLGTMAAMTVGGSALILLVERIATGGSSFGYSLAFMSVVACAMFAIMLLAGSFFKGEKPTNAILAGLIALATPVLMGYYNYDDHNRAGRKTGIAMAINYLESLQPNAIIFTNGDNDTFPLWYAQEVEGIRTDVRVVNLSLLNTDWYIDQMKRKAYLSDPVPLLMPEHKYRQGTRDVMYVDPNRETKDFMPVADVMKVALDDSKFIDNGRSKIAYVPTYKMSLKVDNAAAEQFRQYLHEGDSLVNELKFELLDGRGKPRGFITKANLAVLDLLNNIDWNRPVYFAVTTGGDAYMGLESYFQLEGLAYRLTPIKHKKSENPNLDGGVATETMYNNMMNKFQWGNMDNRQLYMDENNRRMTTNLRLQFSHLAQQLIDEGKLDSAKAVLHKSLDVMPENNVPYEQPQIMWQVVNQLYDAGDKERGIALTKRLIELNNQSLEYYHSLDTRHQALIESDIVMRVQINDRLAAIAKQNSPDDPEIQAIADEVAKQREEFELPSYEDYLKQEEEMKRMKKTQDSIMQLQRKQAGAVSLEGPSGIVRR